MSDLIEQADMLIKDFNKSGYISKHAILILPKLVAEIKRLRSMPPEIQLAHDPICPVSLNGIEYVPRGELVRWQKIAIEERAIVKTVYLGPNGETHPGTLENAMKITDSEADIEDTRANAAKELGLQGYKTNGPIEINGEKYVKESDHKAYIDRLEEAFLDAYHAKIYYGRIYYKKDPGPREERIVEIQAALEKIRRG